MTAPSVDAGVLAERAVLVRNDPDWQFCLVKEIHALLATEALLRAWRTPTLFVLRDPVYVIDSLFAAQTLDTIYLDHEVSAVQQRAFLDEVVPGDRRLLQQAFRRAATAEARRRVVLSKLLAVYLIQRLLQRLGRRLSFTTTVRYEECCEAPSQVLGGAAETLSIPWDELNSAFLERTQHLNGTQGDPYSVFRDTAEQPHRPFAFLSPREVEECRSMLAVLPATD